MDEYSPQRQSLIHCVHLGAQNQRGICVCVTHTHTHTHSTWMQVRRRFTEIGCGWDYLMAPAMRVGAGEGEQGRAEGCVRTALIEGLRFGV